MRAVVKKWGNSASVRIPKNILKLVRLDVDDPVDLREESGRIVENVHRETDVGSPGGNEVVW